MSLDSKFIVFCEKIPDADKYYVRFPYNKELVEKIKGLPPKQRSWNPSQKVWEVSPAGLFTVILAYRKSELIFFDFMGDDNKKEFIALTQKEDEKAKKKVSDLKKQLEKNDLAIKFKKQYEENPQQYADRVLKNLKEGVQLFNHQIVGALFTEYVGSALLSLEMGLGKAENVNSKLLTPNGWIRMGDVKIGDQVIGSNGKPSNVVGVYPQGEKDIYRVWFNDGSFVECCDEHLWAVNSPMRIWRSKTGNKNFPYRILTLRQIMDEGLTMKNGNRKHYIPIVEPIEFNEKKLIIHPYLLGSLLGDGSITTKNNVIFSTGDYESIELIKEILYSGNTIQRNTSRIYDYNITSKTNRNEINRELKRLNLKGCNSYTKFIPNDYKFASIEQRLELLRGLLDTDGHIYKDGSHIEITLASKQLIEDLQFIVQSLGGIGRIKEKWVTYKGERKMYYRMGVKLPPQFIPFKLSRKIERYKPVTKYLPSRAISKIEYVGREEAQCIAVDAPDHLYVTDHCIVTHNTLISISFVEMKDFDKVFVITPNSLKFNYFNEVKKFTNSKAHIIGNKNNEYDIKESKYIIFNYEFFNKSNSDAIESKLKKLGLDFLPKCIVADECFTYDTLIDTDNGKLKIGDIVENKLNVKILSYNHKLKKIERKSISRYLCNGYKDIVRVKFNNGDTIECTSDHKFYSLTENKYKPIKEFTYGEKLYRKKEKNTNERNRLFELQENPQTKKKQPKVLLKKMLCELYFKRKCDQIINYEEIKRKFSGKDKKKLFCLWDRIFNKKNDEKKILFTQLFSNMENVSETNQRKSSQQRNIQENIEKSNISFTEESRVKRSNFIKNEKTQSNVQNAKYRKNERKNYWSNIFIKRWKWSINKTTIKTFLINIRNNIYENGIFNTSNTTIERNEYKNRLTTNTLQSGHWNSISEISNRDRWEYTQNKKMEVFRLSKNRDIEIVWLESIEVLESGNRRKLGESGGENKKVYDLEINDNHNYFANNILVSNCHKLKNTKANTYKNFKKLFKKVEHKVFLSGTPAPNRIYELYTTLNQISPIEFATKKHFLEYYCGMVFNNEMMTWETHNMPKLDELYNKLSAYTYRRRKEDVLDLPKKMYQKICIEMDDNQIDEYREIEEGVVEEIMFGNVHQTQLNPLTVLIRLRQFTAKQKIKMVAELIERLIEEDEKVVVVDMFKQNLYDLHKLFPNISAVHTGDQTVEERNIIVSKFQDSNSDLKLFLGSVQTCSYGLTLTVSNKMFIITLPFSVGEYDQVSDRIHRIGQNSHVTIFIPQLMGTIDEKVYDLIDSKRKEISKAIDNVDFQSKVSESILNDLIGSLKKKYVR